MKKKFGFTMAELLVSLFIVMVIATAMAPIVGPKKTTPLRQRIAHGVFQAFYDNEGVLHCYRFDSNGGSEPAPQNGACEFAPPKANSYYVTVIGAGGDGSGLLANGNPNLNFAYYSINDSRDKAGSLRTDGNFSADFSEAPPVIQQLYEEKARDSRLKVKNADAFRVYYSLKGPSYGPGSPEYCTDDSQTQGANGRTSGHNTNCYSGGAGGKYVIGFIQAVLGKNSTVTQEVVNNGWQTGGYARLCVDGKCLYIPDNTGSGGERPREGHVTGLRNGSDACLDACSKNNYTPVKNEACVAAGGDCHIWLATPSSAYCPYCDQKGGDYGPLLRPLDERVPKAFTYESRNPEIVFRHGYRGKNGQLITKVYGDLQGKRLRMRPAARALDNQGRITSSKLYNVDGNEEKEILSASSGATGSFEGNEFGTVTRSFHIDDNMPYFPNWNFTDGDDAVLAPQQSNEAITYQTFGLHSLIKEYTDNGRARVGEGGSGSYPLIFQEAVETSNWIKYCSNPYDKDLNGALDKTLTKSERYEIHFGEDPSCYPTLERNVQKIASQHERVTDNQPQQFCPAQRGGGGAIIVSW